MKSTLPAIKIIEWTLASSLTYSFPGKISEGIVLDAVSGSFQDLEIEGLGGLSVQSEKQSGQDVYTSVLSFKKAEIIGLTSLTLADLSRNTMCYRLTDVNDQQYLLGLDDKLYPALTYKYDNGETPAGVRIFAVEIRYINLFSVLAIK
jgi:hypothetical protein